MAADKSDGRKTVAENRRARRDYEIEEVLEEGEMPLPSYTWVHKDAILDDAQKESLIQWAKDCMKHMQDTYPPDSLKFKRKKH